MPIDPSWQVAFERGDDLWIAHADGRSAHILVRRAEWPAWSRDGARLAFVRKDGVWVCEADGARPHRVWKGRATSVSWHPSGRRLAICADLGGKKGESIIDLLLGTGQASVFAGLSADDRGSGFAFSGVTGAEWSPTGRYLAFARNGDVWLAAAYVPKDSMGRPGWDVSRIAAVARYDGPTWRGDREIIGVTRLSWSRDEKSLAYGNQRLNGGGWSEVGVLNLVPSKDDGEHWSSTGVWVNRTRDIHPGGSPYEPAFAPDGRTLTLIRWDTEKSRLQLVIAVGEGFRVALDNADHPAWCPVRVRMP